MDQIRVKMPEELAREIEEFQKLDSGLSRSMVVRYWLYKGLDHFRKEGVRGIDESLVKRVNDFLDKDCMQFRLPESILNLAKKLPIRDMSITSKVTYFVFVGMQIYKDKGLEAQAEPDVKVYIRFLDGLNAMIVNNYIPGNEPTRADQQKQEDYLKALEA